MTPQQYQRKAIDLVRSFGPEKERLESRGDFIQPNDPRGPLTGAEFHFKSGLRVHLMFSHKFTHISGKSADWIHFGLHALGEEAGRNISGQHIGNWWKWNIHAQHDIPVSQQRSLLLQQLEHRLERCAEHGAIKRMALATR